MVLLNNGKPFTTRALNGQPTEVRHLGGLDFAIKGERRVHGYQGSEGYLVEDWSVNQVFEHQVMEMSYELFQQESEERFLNEYGTIC